MKKVLAIVVSLLCIACCSLPVFADTDASDTSAVISEVADTVSENLIYEYGDGVAVDLGAEIIGVIIWIVCGVLLAACLVLFIAKFIKWRNSR